ncbi:MAG: NAD(P)/FAD-dependent oxidoreductase [Halodesulfurarchaeum sp.]
MRVVVLGGGYAGVVVATRLEDLLPSDVDLVLVDETGTHLVRHELHRLIRRPGLAEAIQIPLEQILSRTGVVTDRVVGLDVDERVVQLDAGPALDYETAALCLGTVTDFHAISGVEEYGIPLERPAHARAIRERVGAIRDRGEGSVIVGGAGLAGVQAAGEVAEVVREAGVDGVSITLLEEAPHVAPRFGADFRAAIGDALESRGVTVRTGAAVTGATDERIRTADGTEYEYDCLVWTGGIRGTDALSGERPRVRADLRLAEGTFALGDAATVIDAMGSAVVPSAQTAIRQGRVAAGNISARIEGVRKAGGFRPRYDKYRYDPTAWVVSVGDAAVAKVGPQVLTGSPAKALKSTVGVGYLSSAGAIREAVGLVRREFGLAIPDVLDRAMGTDEMTERIGRDGGE